MQTRRSPFDHVLVLRERGRALAVVEHHAVGRRLDTLLDQLPDAPNVVDHLLAAHTVKPPSIDTIEPVM
jgi:hypothetical protein